MSIHKTLVNVLLLRTKFLIA